MAGLYRAQEAGTGDEGILDGCDGDGGSAMLGAAAAAIGGLAAVRRTICRIGGRGQSQWSVGLRRGHGPHVMAIRGRLSLNVHPGWLSMGARGICPLLGVPPGHAGMRHRCPALGRSSRWGSECHVVEISGWSVSFKKKRERK